MVDKAWKEDLKRSIKEKVADAVDATNSAVATNVGKKGAHTSVTSRQRVVQRNGETTVTEERTETKNL
jgi:hypothetical protein